MNTTGKLWQCLASVVVLVFAANVSAHPDIDIQIEQITEQLGRDSRNTELLLKRGDLHRRHEEWSAAKRDFTQVREIWASNPMVDWYEGRMLVASGDFEAGRMLLDRFIAANPEHASARRIRAVAQWQLGLPLAAATDYRATIDLSERPSPALFRALIIALLAAGPEHVTAARQAVDEALDKFSREITILGLGTDLALSQGDAGAALSYLTRLPQRLDRLAQWKFRRGVWRCLDGQLDQAVADFADVLSTGSGPGGPRAGTWSMPHAALSGLTSIPTPQSCMDAVWQTLISQDP